MLGLQFIHISERAPVVNDITTANWLASLNQNGILFELLSALDLLVDSSSPVKSLGGYE